MLSQYRNNFLPRCRYNAIIFARNTRQGKIAAR